MSSMESASRVDGENLCTMQEKTTRTMMLSFISKLNDVTVSPSRFIHRERVATEIHEFATLSDLVDHARDTLMHHYEKSSAYYKREPEATSGWQIVNLWTDSADGCGLRLLSITDHMHRDLIGMRNPASHNMGFGVEGGSFSSYGDDASTVIPPDVATNIMSHADFKDLQNLKAASPYMHDVWTQHSFQDVQSDEVYFEVAFH